MKKTIIILTSFALCIVVGVFYQSNRDSKLQNSIETVAIITYRDGYLTKGYGAHISYFVKNKKYEDIGIECDCRDLKVGDSILIRVAIEDPKIVRIVKKHYMKKIQY